MPTLILPPRLTPDTHQMAHAAEAAGWAVERLATWRVPADLALADPVLYGEPLFADVVAGALDVALLQPPADWLPSLPAAYRQRAIELTTLGAARAIAVPTFIKPADDKAFAAQVYASGATLPSVDVLPEALPVLLSAPVTWLVEYRCFVQDRQVRTWSPSWRDGALVQAADGSWPAPPDEAAAALAFATQVLQDPAVALPPACVLDVGLLAGQGWAVVEANSAWGAGLYGCDPAAVLAVLRRAVVPIAQVAEADKRWVRPAAILEDTPTPTLPPADADGLITLYRPVGAAELTVIAASAYTAFPPRLPEQPVFYPVLNEAYAYEITAAWNAVEGHIGYVTRFRVRADALTRYPVQVVGNRGHAELWVPAEELADFNAAIVGPIAVVSSVKADT
jgi:hypothetical protein